jgi:hypothetical protein
MVLREVHSQLTARIYKNGAQTSACGAVFQIVNGCAAQDWGQLLMFEGQTCSHFGLFTRRRTQWIKEFLTRLVMINHW